MLAHIFTAKFEEVIITAHYGSATDTIKITVVAAGSGAGYFDEDGELVSISIGRYYDSTHRYIRWG
jgi:hypothetical protein